MRVETKPQGINLGVTLQLPDGEIRQLFQPFESQPDMTMGEVAEKAGRYRLNVYTSSNAPSGHYQIRLADLHLATEKERELEQARKLFFESFRLHKHGQNAKALPLMLRSPLLDTSTTTGATTKTLKSITSDRELSGQSFSGRTIFISRLHTHI